MKAIIQKLGPDTCRAPPLFYALSGCDIVSSLYGKGKCKMFDIWLNSAQKKAMTELFIQLGKILTRTTERHMDVLEFYRDPQLSFSACRKIFVGENKPKS